MVWDKEAGGPPIDSVTLRNIIESLPHAAAAFSKDGTAVFENDDFRYLRENASPTISTSGFFDTLTPLERAKLERMAIGSDKVRNDTFQLEWQMPGASTSPTHIVGVTRLSHRGSVSGFLCQFTVDASIESPTLRYLMENLDQGVWDYDLRAGTFNASKAWRALRGWADDHPINMSSEDWLDDVHPNDRDRLRSAFYGQKDGDTKTIVVQYRHRHAEGHWVWILCRASVVDVDSTGKPTQIVGTDTDISDAMNSQVALNRMAGKLKLAVEASGMGIWEFNPDTQQVHWDDRMLEIYGITDGKNIRSENLWETYLHPEDYDDAIAYAAECHRRNSDLKLDFRILRPDGAVRHIRSLARTVSVPDAASKLIGVNIDVTEDYKRTQELELARLKLEHDALHDELTGLGNRRHLDQAAVALFNRVTHEDRYVAMHIDLDHFKTVNDTLGHSAGDFVLRKVGDILKHLAGDLGRPFRVGGDEFAVLFENAPDDAWLQSLCESLIDAISKPMEFEGQHCAVGASIGYAIGQGPPKSQSAIFIEADTALYAAKRAGRYCHRVYTEAIGAEFSLVSNTRQDLRDALDDDQIVCFFQPQYDANTLDIAGAEALVRWQCPKRGLLTPDKFLPNAVDAGMLDAIDHCVFRRVADLQTQWFEQGLDFPRISVNISPARLHDADLIAQTRDVLKPHHRFTFELLETAFVDSLSTELQFKLDSLRQMGIRIEMDDFGTGHSSVRALQTIRPDAVKIDRSLVAPLGTHANQLEILQNLSRIARLENAQVVLEGLETGAHMAAIRMLDCDMLQGYVLQRPVAEIEFSAMLDGLGKSARSEIA